MNVPLFLQLPFVQVALPLLIGIFIAVQVNNRRMDDLRNDFNGRIDDLRNEFNRRFDEVIKRLDRIEVKLDNHEGRIIRLEAEVSPIKR